MKKKILGMPITMLVISLVMLTSVSALVVNYLSNTATTSVEVESPMTIQFAEVDHGDTIVSAIDNVAAVGIWSDDLVLTGTTGLSTIDMGVKIENNADVDISNKNLKFIVSNDLNDVGCSDLTSLTFIDVGASPGTSEYHVAQQLAGIGLCGNNSDGTITYNIPITLLHAGNEYLYPVTMTFGNVQPSTYYFDAVLEN